MFILTNKNNEIIEISNTYELDEEHRNIIVDNRAIAYGPDEKINMFEVEEIPENIQAYKYCYTKEQGFYINENYVEPEEPVENRLKLIEERIALTEDMINMSLGF